MAKPTLFHVVNAILLCSNKQGIFTPTNLRAKLEPDFPRLMRKDLSGSIQPHLSILRDHEILKICKTGQLRNRPHKITNRARLEELAIDRECFLPRVEVKKGDDTIECPEIEYDYIEIDIEEKLSEFEKRIANVERYFDDKNQQFSESSESSESHLLMTDFSKRMQGVKNDIRRNAENLMGLGKKVEEIEYKLKKLMAAMEADLTKTNRDDQGVPEPIYEYPNHNWRAQVNNSSKITWADYFFDDPDCDNPLSKNASFLTRFFSGIGNKNDRDKVLSLLRNDEDLITQFRNLTKCFANLIPNAAFNCPGFTVRGPKPLLTIGRVKKVNGEFGSSIIIVTYYGNNNKYKVQEGFHVYAKKLGEDDNDNINNFLYDQYTQQNYHGTPYKRLMERIQFNGRSELVFSSTSTQKALASICNNLKTQIDELGHSETFLGMIRPDDIPNSSPIYPKFIREAR